MASPLTSDFLDLARENANEMLTLVKIELTEPSALTLRFGEEELTTPDGQTWEKGLSDPGAIETSCTMLQTKLAQVSYSCEIADLEYSVLSGKLSEVFATYLWHGASITVYQWLPRLTDFADAAQVFIGQLTFMRMEGMRIILDAERTFSFNVRLPAEEVTRSKYPRAPEKSIGRCVPFIIGSHRTPPALSPATAYGDYQWGAMGNGGARGGLKGVVVSAGRGSAGGTTTGEKGLVLFASHACKTFQDESVGCSPFLEYADKLCDLDTPDDVNDAAIGTGFYIDDVSSGGVDPFDVFYAAHPQDIVLAASNNAENGRALLDRSNLRSYCRLDYDAGYQNLALRFGTSGAKGLVRDILLVAGFASSHTMSGVLGPIITLNGVGGGASLGTVASATPTADSVSLPSLFWPTEPWDLSQLSITAGFSGVATGRWINLYFAYIAVIFRPEWPIIEGPSRRAYSEPREGGARIRGQEVSGPGGSVPKVEVFPPRREFNSSAFYFAGEGIEDDGSGTYTGVAGALIESPPDALHWVLVDRLGFSAGDLSLGSDFGSLVEARNYMKTWRRSGWKCALGVTEFQQADRVIEDICSAGLMLPVVNRFTGEWNVVPWRSGKPVDYDWVFGFDDLLDGVLPDIEVIPTDVENDFELEYWIDDWSKLGSLKVTLGATRSNSGHLYGQIRDEDLTVVSGVNDRLDFTDSAARTANLTAAAYATGGALAAHIQTQMRAVAGGSRIPFVSYGFEVVAGSNDKIDMVENGVALVATLNPGIYTAAELATEVARAMNAASINASTYGCTYSDSTRKFTVTQSGAIGILNSFTFAAAAPSLLTCAAVLLGFSFAVQSYPDTSDNEVEAESFYFATSGGSLVLNHETGANGINAATMRTCAALVGHDPQRDLTATTWLAPHSPKGAREQAMAESRARFGSPDPRPRQFRGVNDTDTIREIRNELAALLRTPPVRVFFRTTRAPDLELGRIISFDDTLDEHRAYPGYGSDGSWEGKRFVVLGITHYLGAGLKHQQIHAASIP